VDGATVVVVGATVVAASATVVGVDVELFAPSVPQAVNVTAITATRTPDLLTERPSVDLGFGASLQNCRQLVSLAAAI
jgi:hypothetical protein